MENNIVNIFEEQVRCMPSKLALIEQGRSVTFGELGDKVNQCAARYNRKGIYKGAHVLVLIPVSIDLYINVLALFKLGAVVVFTDEWVNSKRLSVCIDKVGVDYLVTSMKGFLFSYVHSGLRQIKNRVIYKSTSEQFVEHAAIDRRDSALVTFTTGSTGTPKAANRTHEFLLAQFTELSTTLSELKDNPCMTTLPIVALCCIGMGITTLLPSYNHKEPSKTDLKLLSDQIISHGVKSIIGSPYLMHQLCDFSHDLRLSHIYVGGAAVFASDAEKWIKHFAKTKIEIIYGSTEAEPISQISAFDLVKQSTSNSGVCVGEPNEHIKLKIIEISDMPIGHISDTKMLEEGVSGEVIVAGDHVLQDYINSPEALKSNKISGRNELWHRTGDAGYVKDGVLYLVGRASQMILINDRQVGVFQIEERLSNIEGVTKGTILKVNDEIQIIVDGLLTEKSINEIHESIGSFKVRSDIKIPMDPRHHSKIDYARLQDLI